MAAAKGSRGFFIAVLVLGGLGMAAMIAFVKWANSYERVSSGDKARIEKALAIAEARAVENDARWHAAISARASLTPGEAPCPVAKAREKGALAKQLGAGNGNGPDLDDWLRNVQAAQAASGASNEEIVDKTKLAEAKSPLRRMFEYERDALKRDMGPESTSTKEPAKLVSKAEELASPDFWRWDLVVIVDQERIGAADPEKKTFEGGFAVGDAYVFDYKEGRVTCAGSATATSSEVLHAVTGLGRGPAIYGEIGRDLQAQLLEASKKQLKAVPVPAPAGK